MFRSILVPVDLAELGVARRALSEAVALARHSEGTLTLVSVVPVIPVTALDSMPVTYEAEMADRALADLKDVAASLDLPAGRVKVATRIGGVPQAVLDLAAEESADLIVVGSHQPAIATYLIGSNAGSIVRHAPCSILVVREPAGTPAADQLAD